MKEKKNKKPSEIYLELGFEALPHFSFAFKKRFGYAPTELTELKKIPAATSDHTEAETAILNKSQTTNEQ